MKYFSLQFSEANSSVIEYNGRRVYRGDKFSILGHHKIKFTFISTNSPHTQAIVLATGNMEGDIYYNQKQHLNSKSPFSTLDIFEKDYGKEVILDVNLFGGKIGIYNGAVRKIGEKEFVSYCWWGSAMIIEEISPTKKRYYCNDYENDDDFDDLIFEMEILD